MCSKCKQQSTAVPRVSAGGKGDTDPLWQWAPVSLEILRVIIIETFEYSNIDQVTQAFLQLSRNTAALKLSVKTCCTTAIQAIAIEDEHCVLIIWVFILSEMLPLLTTCDTSIIYFYKKKPYQV